MNTSDIVTLLHDHRGSWSIYELLARCAAIRVEYLLSLDAYMNIRIRQEQPDDYPVVAEAIKLAYNDVPHSNHREQFMVERLRNSGAFVPELSLVAEMDQKIVGHILLTKIFIHGEKKSVASLALAPLSVVPEFQGKGVGSLLVGEGNRIAAELGYGSIVVLGPGAYYSRFGYEKTTKYGLTLPFAVREENCRVICLVKERESELTGTVEYHPAWWSDYDEETTNEATS